MIQHPKAVLSLSLIAISGLIVVAAFIGGNDAGQAGTSARIARGALTSSGGAPTLISTRMPHAPVDATETLAQDSSDAELPSGHSAARLRSGS